MPLGFIDLIDQNQKKIKDTPPPNFERVSSPPNEIKQEILEKFSNMAIKYPLNECGAFILEIEGNSQVLVPFPEIGEKAKIINPLFESIVNEDVTKFKDILDLFETYSNKKEWKILAHIHSHPTGTPAVSYEDNKHHNYFKKIIQIIEKDIKQRLLTDNFISIICSRNKNFPFSNIKGGFTFYGNGKEFRTIDQYGNTLIDGLRVLYHTLIIKFFEKNSSGKKYE